MHLYRCDITLHDYLFFATIERGRLAETGPFLHNYALTYAFGWATSPWHHERQKPRYQQELALVGKRYLTPARMVRGSSVLMQYNTRGESYYLERGQKSVGYPDWGFLKCIRPGALFRCHAISAAGLSFPRFVRLGKFMAKAAVRITAAGSLEQRRDLPQRSRGAGQPQGGGILLTWDDLAPAARPVIYDIFTQALPGSLIDNAVFTGIPGPYLVARFADQEGEVHLPMQMGYYGEQLCASW